MSDLLSQYRNASPELKDLTDDELIKAIHLASGDKGSPYDYARSVLGYQDKGSRLKDFGIDVARSVGAIGEIATGAIDLATGGRGSKAWRDSGRMDPVQEYKQNLAKGYSTKRNEAAYNVDAATGFMGKLGALKDNPSVAIGMMVEQAPSLAIPFGAASKVGAAAVKGAMKVGPRTPKALRFADELGRTVGETAGWAGVTMGQTAAQMQQIAPGDDKAMYDAAGLSGGATAAITAGFSFLPGGQIAKQAIGGVKRYGAATANVMGQSAGEAVSQQGATNYALGKPIEEGLGEAAAIGLAIGTPMGALAGRKRPDFDPPAAPPAPATGSAAPFTTVDLERTWRRPAVPIQGDEPLIVSPQGEAMNPQQFEAYQQFQNQPHPDLAEAPAQPQAEQQNQDPASQALAQLQAEQSKPAKPQDPPPEQAELDALFAKIGAPELVPARRPDGTTIMNDDGKPLMVRHWDGSDKQKVPAPYTSPEKMKKAVEKAIKAEREKPAGIRAAEASMATAIREELGRFPTSKELSSLVKETELDGIGDAGQEFSPARLTYQVDIALKKLEGKKSPDAQFKRDALAIWKKAIEAELKKTPKPEAPKGPQKAPAPEETMALATEPPVEVLAALAERVAEPERVAEIKTHNGKTLVLTPQQYIERLRNSTPEDQLRFMRLTGWDQNGDAVNQPMTHAQVAKLEGKTAGAISNWAKDWGLTKEVVDRMAGTKVESVGKEQEAGFMDNTDESTNSGMQVYNSPGELKKAGLMGNERTAAQKRADAVADKFLAENKSVEVPEIVTPKEAEVDAAIEAKRQAQAELNKLKDAKRALETPYRAEAIREFNALRSKKAGEKRFEELEEQLQTDWVLLYDYNERADMLGHADDVNDLFADFKKEHYDRLVRTGEPSADRAGEAAIAGPRAEEALQPRADQDGDAGVPEVPAPASAGPAPRIVTKRKRVPVTPDGAQFSTGRAATTTPEFKEWFGDSKVVDANGDPLVVYHGSPIYDALGKRTGFNSFDAARQGDNTGAPSAKEGFFFTDSLENAAHYGGGGGLGNLASFVSDINYYKQKIKDLGGDNSLLKSQVDFYRKALAQRQEVVDKAIADGQIMPLYLNIRNPLEFDFGGKSYREQSFKALLERAKREGHDGAIFKNVDDPYRGTVYVAFDSTQIKSATGNNGKFDPKNPDITKALQRNEPGASYRTTFELEKELKLFMNASTLGKMVRITDSKSVDNIKGSGWAEAYPTVMGFATTEGKVVLIADRIPRGEGKGVFLHELGSHLGIDRMLPPEQRAEVARKIADWSRNDDGETGQVARAAMERTAWAEKDSTIQRQETEIIAYFIEEALAHGVRPTIHGSGAARLLHKIKELFQNALRKIFGGRVNELTMQDMVDLAYGAAQRNISDKPITQNLSHMDGVFDTTGRAGALGMIANDQTRLKRIEGSLENLKGLEDTYPDDFATLTGWKDRLTTNINKLDRLYKPYEIGAVQFSQRRTVEKNISKLPVKLRRPARGITAAVHDFGSKVLRASSFMHDLADGAVKIGLTSAKKIADYSAIKGALKIKLDQDLGKIVKQLQDLPDDTKMRAQRFLLDSTLSQEWGYEPTWRPKVDVSPAAKAKWDALPDDAKAVADAMLKHGWEVWKAKQDAIRDLAHTHYTEMVAEAEARGADRAEIDKLWAEMDKMVNKTTGLVKGPYVPLKRAGTHVVSMKSQELLDAIANKDPNLEEMLADPKHYVVEFVDGAYKAANREAELREKFPGQLIEMSRREEHEYLGAGYEILQRLADRVRTRVAENEGDRDTADATYRALQEAIIESLGEFNARSSTLQRKNISGMNPMEIGRAFAAQGYADNRFLAGAKLNKEINDAMAEMRVQLKTGGNRTKKQEFYNEFQKRRANAMNVQMPSWAGHAMRFTTLWKLVTSPAYYLQYLTQPITMFLPAIQGRHGYGKSVTAFIEGVKTVSKMHRGLDELDFSAVANTDERAMLQTLRDNGTIQIGHEQMFGRIELQPENGISKLWQNVSEQVQRIPHTVEAHNRAASALAAYRMERKAGASHEDAVKYVKEVILQTYGDYSSFNAPRIFQPGRTLGALGPMVMQYRQFQFIHTALLSRVVKAAFGGADAETKKAARLQLGYMAGHYGVLAGALGVPAAHVVGHALRLALGDEQDKDLETFVKRHVEDKTMQDMVLGGVPRVVLGQDWASRIGAGDILDPMRYGSIGGAVSSKEGYKDFMTAAMGPFLGGMVPQVIDGVNTIGDGDVYRGMEKLMPKGIADAMRAVRIMDEGLVDNKGAEVATADEIGMGDIIAKGLGSTPVSVSAPSHDSFVASTVIREFKDKSNKLKSQYVRAKREGEDVEEIVEEFKELMRKQKAAGIKPQTLSDLYKAPAEMRKREKRTVGGVQFRPGTEELVRDIVGEKAPDDEE